MNFLYNKSISYNYCINYNNWVDSAFLSIEKFENITYNQFYNNFTESLNDYANELITQTKTLYDKFGNSAVRLLYGKEKRWNTK